MNDLEMNELYCKIDTCMTSAGEEVLYSQLHFCDEKNAADISAAADLMSRDDILRMNIYKHLIRMGILNYNGVSKTVCGQPLNEFKQRWLYILLPIIPWLGIPLMLLNSYVGVSVFILGTAVNMVMFYMAKRQIAFDLGRTLYISSAIKTAVALAKNEKIQSLFPDLNESVQGLHDINKYASMLITRGTSDSDLLAEIIKMPFQAEVHVYHEIRKLIMQNTDKSAYIYNTIGIIDAACAILNYRENLGTWCKPEFVEHNIIETEDIYHPMISNAVTNSISIDNDILLTGSNASGKSSFIKACAINAIFAQSIGVCTAKKFALKRGRVISSMAVRDCTLDGDSYFMAELKSLRRLVKYAENEGCICFVDEILKGTNTAERIAASESVLEYLHKSRAICIAATHDIELTRLENGFTNYHFTEYISDGIVCFDYKIYEGAAISRNAILLMGQLGFDKLITDRAVELCGE